MKIEIVTNEDQIFPGFEDPINYISIAIGDEELELERFLSFSDIKKCYKYWESGRIPDTNDMHRTGVLVDNQIIILYDINVVTRTIIIHNNEEKEYEKLVTHSNYLPKIFIRSR